MFDWLFSAEFQCYTMWSSDLFFLHPAVSRVFHSPGFSGYGSWVWVQVLEVAVLLQICSCYLLSATLMLVDLFVAVMKVTVSVAIMQFKVSATLMSVKISAANTWVTIFIEIMQPCM